MMLVDLDPEARWRKAQEHKLRHLEQQQARRKSEWENTQRKTEELIARRQREIDNLRATLDAGPRR